MKARSRVSGGWAIAGFAVLAALLVPSSAQAAACNYRADAPAGGTWHLAANWDCNEIPDGGDTVTLDGNDDVSVSSADANASTLTMSGSATVRFAASHVLAVTGSTSVSSGTVTGAGRLNANGGLAKGSTGQFSVNGGALLAAAGVGSWSAGPICLQSNGILRVTGSLGVAAGDFGFNCQDASALVDIDPGATVTVAGGAANSRDWNAPLENDGLLDLDGGRVGLNSANANAHDGNANVEVGARLTLASTQTFAATARVGGSGTLEVTAGGSTMAGGATLEPATLAIAGGSLSLDGAAPATTLPTVTMTGGTFTGARDRAVTVLNAQSGALTGGHTTTAATLTKSTPGQFSVTSGATLDATSDGTWSDGPICMQSSGILRVTGSLAVAAGTHGFNCQDPSALVDIDAGGEITVAGTAGQVRSWNAPVEIDGRLQVDGSTPTLNSAGPNTHDGEVEVNAPGGVTLQSAQAFAGTARIGGSGTIGVTAGASTVAGGATLDPATLNLANGSLSLDGAAPATTLPTVTMSGGTFTGARNRAVTTLNAQSGTLAGAHTTTAAALHKTTPGQFAVNGGATLVAAGDGTWTDGPVCMQSGGVLRVTGSLAVGAGTHGFNCQDPSALVDIDPAGEITVAGAVGQVRSWNAPTELDGLLQVDGSTLTLNSAGPNTHDGEVEINAAGGVTLQSNQAFAGTARVGGAGTLGVTAGASTLAGGVTLDPATLNLANGSLSLDGAAPATTLPEVNFSGGTFTGRPQPRRSPRSTPRAARWPARTPRRRRR